MNTIEYVNAQNTALIKERDQLRARVKVLEQFGKRFVYRNGKPLEGAKPEHFELLNETPQQSLAQVQAEITSKAVIELSEQFAKWPDLLIKGSEVASILAKALREGGE